MSEMCCRLEDFAKAMADETRQNILSLLQAGELSESDIVERINLSQPTISYHLAQLRRAGLLLERRQGHRVFFRANHACVSACCNEIQARFSVRLQDTQPQVPGASGRGFGRRQPAVRLRLRVV